MEYPVDKAVNRIIDANINRSKEGLRVLEEITRFVLNLKTLTAELKRLRHRLDTLAKDLPGSYKALLEGRNSVKDIGRLIHANELKRNSLKDIFLANAQRVKESLRVLEEFSKLKNTGCALEFKKIRYRIYEIEKKTAERIASLSAH